LDLVGAGIVRVVARLQAGRAESEERLTPLGEPRGRDAEGAGEGLEVLAPEQPQDRLGLASGGEAAAVD